MLNYLVQVQVVAHNVLRFGPGFEAHIQNRFKDDPNYVFLRGGAGAAQYRAFLDIAGAITAKDWGDTCAIPGPGGLGVGTFPPSSSSTSSTIPGHPQQVACSFTAECVCKSKEACVCGAGPGACLQPAPPLQAGGHLGWVEGGALNTC